jgi:hypothetical protein
MQLLAQTYTTSSGSSSAVFFLYLLFYVVFIAAYWTVFTKAGQPGWAAIIPIYNIIVLLKIVGREWWWIFLFLIPIVNFVMFIIVMNDLSKSFGKGVGFTVGLILLSVIFILILGFGSATYIGPRGQAASGGFAAQPPPPPPPPPTF